MGRSSGGFAAAAGDTSSNDRSPAVCFVSPPVARKKSEPAVPASMVSFASQAAPEAVKRAFVRGFHSPAAVRAQPFPKRARRTS